MSMYIQGKIVGVLDKQGQARKDEATGAINPGNMYGVVGIQTEGTDFNGFETLTTVSVNVYRDNYASRLHDRYRALVGQEVLMPVQVGTNNNRLNYILTGLPLKPAIEAFEPVRKNSAELVASAREARGAPDLTAKQPQPAQAAKA